MVENVVVVENLNVKSDDNYEILKSISLNLQKNEILSIIGPSNSGKTTFLQALNRLIDLKSNFLITGKVLINNQDIFSKNIDVEVLRRKVGMIFALPISLPMSIFENVAYGLKRSGIKKKSLLEEVVEESLKAAYLWDEVKNRLSESALNLSGGQQQRLGVARILALKPEVILFDEPCSGLDPISTMKIEESMYELKKTYSLILVTNNTKQAARVGDRTGFFLMGNLIEIGNTEQIFTTPKNKQTEDYISGRFG